MRMRCRLRPLVAGLVTAALVAGCSGGTATGSEGGSGSPKRGGQLILATNTEPATLDPATCATYGWERCEPIFGTLLRYDQDMAVFEPGMAESFESADGKTWTLKLRSGLKFTDGTPFDAAAVVFNWDRIKDPKTLSPAASIAKKMTWSVVDPLTVKVTVAQTNYQLPWALVLSLSMIGSPAAIQKAGPDFGNAPVGAGPFVFKDWTRNTQITYERNNGYWEEGKPYADRLVTKTILQDDQRLNALRAGEINVDWSLLTKDAKKMAAEGFNVYKEPLVGGTGLRINFKDADLKDPDLRQAILKAVDSEQINAAVYPGDRAADAFFPPDHAYRDDTVGTYPKKDLEGAQKLFDSYLAKTGKSSLSLTFGSYAGVPLLEQVAQLLQSQLQKIKGLTIDIKATDSPTLQKSLSSGTFQLAMSGVLSQQADYIYDVFHSDGTLNYSGYANPKVDKALEITRSAKDEKTVADAYQVVNGEISKDAPMRFWRYQTGHLYTPKYVKGVKMSALSATFIEGVWIDN
ncbi:peptide/nickel transport system substrate-binding protein [Kribbella sp. VKM Ac-2527]|uniref:Peptide/nickel transport system substrate-binding protein n=1 Tax=Kribbella caucasensis TaxID=2512215 RepID=A0A4R6KD51_9ACTN|nr:ABC transporter substrate-binding protein [Kribbella sp. VKM Ac-2527]TDO46395.1 peptide/nickel transport system substrate-binding protein [Kribbella sp. VKM Ac-2527]